MESLLIGSIQQPSSLLSFPGTSLRVEHVKKHKAFINSNKLRPTPMGLHLPSGNLMHKRSVKLNTKRGLKCIVSSTSEDSLESEPSQSTTRTVLPSTSAFAALYRFLRPYTVIGTVLSISSVSLLAVEKLSDFTPLFFTGVLKAIVAALLINTYVIGLNQLTDIEIDKVNKPYLPLASGEISVRQGVMIVSSCALMGFCLAWIVGSWPLFWGLFVWFSLGTAYSMNLPLLRWKRFSAGAAMCIVTVRGLVNQIAFYLHVQMHVFGRPAIFPKPVIFAIAIMSIFATVIALFKDIPDIAGDTIFGIQSLTVRLGQTKVFWICILLLEMTYAIALFVGVTSPSNWSKWITVICHTALGLLLWTRAKSTDLKSKEALASFYMFIWKLFYAEYLLIPLVR